MAVQRRAQSADTSPASEVPPIVHDVLRSPGQPLDSSTRAFMEPRFGHDFGNVSVHTNSRAAESAHAITASAYAVGRDVVFGSGQYDPHTTAGQRLLAHELTHVGQQSVQSTSPGKLELGRSDDRLEREARQMASFAATPNFLGAAGNMAVQRAPVSASSGGTVYICTKPILGSLIHRQGHAFFRIGGPGPGNPTFELEHARSCYCGWQGWPRHDVAEDRDADVPCVPTAITEQCLRSNWNSYPVGKYCARGPNSNTYVRVISARCGSTVRPPGNVAGYDESPPPAGGAGAPHPYLSVIGCFDVDCDDTECGIIPGINQGIIPGPDPAPKPPAFQ